MSNIIFENDACLVFNKRCGEDSEKPEGLSGLKPVNRLDTPASGCLLLAKTKEAAAFLSVAFPDAARSVEKRYWAVIEKPKNESLLSNEWMEITHWLSFSSKLNKSFAHDKASPKTKKAVLRLRLAGSGDNYLFAEVDLVTGRHHQIRAQLAALGLHIKGDLKYGSRRSEKSGGIRLHARSIRFPNPIENGETIYAEAPLLSPDPLWEAFEKCIEPHFNKS